MTQTLRRWGAIISKICFTVVAILWASVPAIAENDPHDHVWSIRSVGKGCNAIFHDASLGVWDNEDNTVMGKITGLEWTGSCDSNGLIDGKGTLLIHYQSDYSQARSFEETTASHGMLHGSDHYRREERDNASQPWHQVESSEISGEWTTLFANGCEKSEVAFPCDPQEGVAKRNQYLAMMKPDTATLADAANVAFAPPAMAAASISANAKGDVFNTCIKLESLGRPGIEMIWQLKNICSASIRAAYCFKSKFSAAGDPNLCMRSEHRNTVIAAGAAEEFAFTLEEDGVFMGDGRIVENDELEVVGHACANGNSPGVRFDNKQFVFTGC